MKTIQVKDLTVKVTYEVGLGNLEMPEKVYEQILEADSKGDKIESGGMPKYLEASEWLTENIRERDCMDWSAEVIEIIENK